MNSNLRVGLLFLTFSITCLQLSATSIDKQESGDCTFTSNRVGLSLLDLGYKQFYFGFYFKANWHRAAHFCRFHGMDLASIASQYENDALESYRASFGIPDGAFWLSGNDLDEEGRFYWLGNGRPMNYTNWQTGEPNNSGVNQVVENCVYYNSVDGKWNDLNCQSNLYFVCEIQ